MYLKSIEVQGFKSFANRILFEFHNGITGIVGPNGSGKSNVADAVRWVLGEQRAKQLRGAKMEDVIFSGTEIRKPVSYAYVAITLDNSDRALAVDYDEVVVTRKVFRSGESEYLINGNACRLKDVNELFYDTGIGKEGYSIIGQGQIDRILSGKPEERRELFDEAAGIVKFKRRKAAAVKKLEDEQMNLTRVNDILSELEKQVGPLEKQSEKAKQYLKLKEELKKYDVNLFLLETNRIKTQLKDLSDKYEAAGHELSEKQAENESVKEEYERIEAQIESLSQAVDEYGSRQNEMVVNKGRLEGQINVLNEQINTLLVNDEHLNERIQAVNANIVAREEEKAGFGAQREAAREELEAKEALKTQAEEELSAIQNRINELNQQIENNKNEIIEILNEKAQTKTKSQRYETMLEQIGIRKAELTSRILKGKSDEAVWQDAQNKYQKELDEVNVRIDSLNQTNQELSDEITVTRNKVADLTAVINKEQQQYHGDKSKLESLRNITERYDGYGNSIRKVMEQKAENKGILGVIADIIKVEKKYEIAIETALGGTIQNIVTDNENTAKGLIAYLKENKFGRATFLPLSSISGKNTLSKEPCLNEKGVIGIASDLVKVSFEYVELSKYLLGRVLVVDNIDNALAIARKYKYSLRIVTLEGEQLNPGGSMTGGAFKNSSNLLGRRREIEELAAQIKELSAKIEKDQEEVKNLRALVGELRTNLEENNKTLRDTLVLKNTAQMNLKQAMDKKDEIVSSYKDSADEAGEIDRQIAEIKGNLDGISGELSELDSRNAAAEKNISDLTKELEDYRQKEMESSKHTEEMHLTYSTLLQKDTFVLENIRRVDEEISRLTDEMQELKNRIGSSKEEIEARKKDIGTLRLNIEDCVKLIQEYEEKTVELRKQKEDMSSSHKAFFEKREVLSAAMAELDKECFRLNSQMEKLSEASDAQYEYMWNEYEITMSVAIKLRDEELNDLSAIKKNVSSLKGSIKALGDVNVNAIEDYRVLSERYEFLKNQHDDLVEAEAALQKIIEELDTGMRVQFEQKFAEIKVEFDKVFKELFGGGKGTLELVEDEDILEAGIRIISQPPGKKLQNMMQLSGGEKALTAIALLFAIQNLKPSPFCLLDEIEAALDDSNVTRFAQYLHKLTKHTQFIVITHRRGTMACADRLYGITMQEKGVSTLVSVDLIEKDLDKNNQKE
ncbi:MAG: chromosome segregation protein SMC [Thermoflexaceae bacterium]|nr:chromosome segregation protein SMC [Thermoflexaceae bacterium]